MYFVISYDVTDDKRRTKIHKVLKSYGQWMQYSVFECELTETQYAKLRSRLSTLIKPQHDSIRFYSLCRSCHHKIERIGGEMPRDESIFFAESLAGQGCADE
ncbi:MAG TPA: CRISPR-associated endonuclease Cas2 [Synechococcales cyanobacterium M55_K2018_004]|nr:CRISPR-associated endonuclease Cas2 [Synechococcales cyanobacterium M55_K2018_004]